MSRVEDNLELIKVMTERNKSIPSGTADDITCLQLANIATFLVDISSSLAVIADSVKEEEK